MDSKIYALVGPFASGKRSILAKLVELGVHYVPTYTTRQYDEKSGLRDFYITVGHDEFFQKELMTKVAYQGEYYGLQKKDVLSSLTDHKKSCLILDVGAISPLARLLGDSLVTIYILTDYISLVGRMLKLGCTNDDIKYQLEYAESNKIMDAWKTTTAVVKNTKGFESTLMQILAIMGLLQLPPPRDLAEILK